jgi:hypothetical protein
MPPDDALRRLAQLQAELCAARQTNIAIEVSELAGAFLVSEQTDKVKTDVGILRRLRSGNTNLIELLEDDLDTSIETLTHFQLGQHQLKALQAAKQYREKFPRTTDDPKMDAKVARALTSSGDK